MSCPSASPSASSSPPVDVGVYRRVAGRFPTGVCIVTTLQGDPGRELDHAMTASSFTSVSLEPPLVLVCVETEARFHDAVLDAGVWAVSILDATARPAASWLATRGRPLHGQLDRVPFHRGPVTGAALVDAATGWLECRTTAVHPGGDHSIVVGEVVWAAANEDDAAALVHHRGAWARLGPSAPGT